jgi:signal transduction histidine kinase/CHASE3 domain sensor protein
MSRNLSEASTDWWDRLSVQRKVISILAGIFAPLLCAFLLHFSMVNHLLRIQEQREQIVLVREQVHILRRLGVDIEDAFRGYLLTRQEKFLLPMKEAEAKLDGTLAHVNEVAQGIPGLDLALQKAEGQLKGLLESKHRLIKEISKGHVDQVNQYVASGEGLALSDTLRDSLRQMEDHLYDLHLSLSAHEGALTRKTFFGLALAVLATLGLAWLGVRLLSRSVTHPLTLLHASVIQYGLDGASTSRTATASKDRHDEIGDLGRVYQEMVRHIRQYILELEAIISIGHDISILGPDGIDGVLHRITDRAVELLDVDVCLVMIRHEQMSCWIIEAASGDWNDRLRKNVMLWEEFPVSVKAFDSKEPVIGADLSHDQRPAVARRNLIGESLLAVPLINRGQAFGVLVLLHQEAIPEEAWNLRLAKGLAEEAAIALSNARLYEQVQERGKGLQLRLKQLEHLAENLAHDLKAPGERMEELASALRTEYGNKLDERAARWLQLMEDNGRDLSLRVEKILEVARVGGRRDAVEAVDPAGVIESVLKAMAGDLERQSVRVHVQPGLPLVACHRAYLAQVFDNLLSNAVKFACREGEPVIRIEAHRNKDRVEFSVSDNGRGIPPEQRERAFETFVRLDPASAKGSGIGLAIVQRIVELYGGRAWIESAEPGCRVHFTMPALGDFGGEGI